ncbi:probable ubiquitin carboxyl-terminal hydrolase MINDY-4 isoform X2 [Rhinatrema bivittatum]|uniref:probable ubiquitin carboxyl-terminal hydrolase MINDY-4 isoform X2 n=1 Tax=Rhinatrema bivittatum TaxID=194408 RepID=UPI00112DA281|nr:probable ubiquitin carboxyl-terminal hydrolase MINDY-4 isoform X2 [Rhinatrema bivittatum]
MDNAFVEAVASSLVREFLSRKGLKRTCATMDQEFPRSEHSINNRNELRNVLRLESLYKQNKAKENPLKTILEIITKYFLEHFENTENTATSVPENRRRLATVPVSLYEISDEETGGSTAVSDTSKTEAYRWEEDTATSQKQQSRSNLFTEARAMTTSLLSKDEKMNLNINCEHALKTDESAGESRTISVAQRPKSCRVIRGMMTGPVASSEEDFCKKRVPRRSSRVSSVLRAKDEDQGRNPSQILNTSVQNTTGTSQYAVSHISSSTALKLGKEFSDKVLADCLVGSTHEKVGSTSSVIYDPVTKKQSERELNWTKSCLENDLILMETQQKSFLVNSPRGNSGDGQEKKERASMMSESLMSVNRRISQSISNEAGLQKEDVIVDDFEIDMVAEEVQKIPVPVPTSKLQVAVKPIDLSLAMEMKTLLFGTSLRCFNEEWKMQSFTFSDRPQLRYGIIQKKGGPCGVLAVLQGCVLQKLLFEDEEDSRCLQPSDAHRTKCLLMAIADVLWHAGNRNNAVVALYSGRQQFSPAGRYKADGITEMLLLHTFTNYEDLTVFLQQCIHQFEAGPFGCILLTLSAVFSRTIELVRKDFDVSNSYLIGTHGYCTQELVNLLLTGRAVSNVFNDTVELNSENGNITLLKGITVRSDIGFLSRFEHYNICQVGSYLKTPKYPIWVVCSESHFSILFCLRKELMNDWKIEKHFDLYYYDGLANQQEEICLTVDTMEIDFVDSDNENELIPPLEDCIRTKWKGSSINWNGTEPIL